MPAIKDFFNRIKNAVFGKKEIPMLDIPKKIDIIPNNLQKRDAMLSANLNLSNLEIYNDPNNYNDYCKNFFKIPGNFEKQYDYVELITMMQENGSMEEYQKYLKYVNDNPSLYYPSAVHGVSHTSRVLLFAEMLCMLDGLSLREKNLVMTAAQLHDIGREDDTKDFDHGRAGKEKIEQLGLLRNFSDRERDIIEFAIEAHSIGKEKVRERLEKLPKGDRKDYQIVLDYLQDADKLDRTRIANKGWGLDPNRLTTDTAKKMVKVAHQNYYEYSNLMKYEQKIDEKDLYGNKLTLYLDLLRQKGFNISLQDFSNILSEYKPGTLEMLYGENRLEDLFSYNTFIQYKKEESFNEKIKADKLDASQIFSEVTQRQQVELTQRTFEANFMLYYNLKKNNPDAYDLLCYVDLDMNEARIAGIIETIQITDLDKINRNGRFFSMNNLVELASNYTPEEYLDIVNNGNIEDLYSSKFCKNQEELQKVWNILQNNGINIDVGTFHSNFRLLQELTIGNLDILKYPGSEQFSIPEIYGVVTRLRDAKYRIRSGKTSEFDYDTETVYQFLEYSSKKDFVKELSEEEILDLIEEFAKNPNNVKNPRFIQYKSKKNKPLTAEKIEDILNYNEFCANQVLCDPNITLKDAKKIMVNVLFNIDVPDKHKEKFEKELINLFYYHKKYLPYSDKETNHGKVLDSVRDLFSSKNIEDFKDILYQNKGLMNCYNTEKIGNEIQCEVEEFSRRDMVSELKNTEKMIEEMPSINYVASNGQVVNVKVLNGQPFCLATSTIMPKCSGMASKVKKQYNDDPNLYIPKIRELMLGRQQSGNEKCVSIMTEDMIAHASSVTPELELLYGYVPESQYNISIAGKYDLSTSRNANGYRTTNLPTTPRTARDLSSETTEEHNEVVMNAIPRFIVCFDQISEIAIEKKAALEQELNSKGINQTIDIVLVEGKDKYLPQIRRKIDSEHENISQKLKDGQYTYEDFENMFERKESNFVLRTLQTIHSTSYRDDVWNEFNTRYLLNSMTDILERVSQIVPPDKARAVEEQVSILIDRADRNTDYGYKYYDQVYADLIDTSKLEDIRNNLLKKIQPYERSQLFSSFDTNDSRNNTNTNNTTTHNYEER